MRAGERPGNLNREKPYAPSEATIIERAVVRIATYKLFKKYFGIIVSPSTIL